MGCHLCVNFSDTSQAGALGLPAVIGLVHLSRIICGKESIVCLHKYSNLFAPNPVLVKMWRRIICHYLVEQTFTFWLAKFKCKQDYRRILKDFGNVFSRKYILSIHSKRTSPAIPDIE